MLRVSVAVFVLACLFNGLQGQTLTCLCTGNTCSNNVTVCTDVNDLCYGAEIRLQDASIRIERGCKLRSECNHTDYCPVRAAGSVCAKFGCCTYDRCLANYTLGADFELAPTPSPSTTQKPLVAKSSSLVLEPSSSVVPMTTKPEMPATSTEEAKMPATSTEEAKMPATSTVQAEMTSEPVMPTAKMTAVKPMTSAPPEMKTTSENMMSSVQIAPSGSMERIATKQILKTDGLPPDTRPTCASERVFSLGTFLLVAIGLLCGLF